MASNEDASIVHWFKVMVGIVLVLLVVSMFFGAFYTIGSQERGVLATFGRVQDTVINDGLHFKVPFIQSITKLQITTQKYETDASAASKDLQTVHTKIAVNYHLSSESVPTIFKEIGVTYQDRVIQPAVQEVVKASTAQFTAEELISKRPEVKELILTKLKDRLATRNIIVEDISITDFDFSVEFNQAIELKVTAEQNALAAQNKLAQIKFEAQQKVEQSKGEAQAIQIINDQLSNSPTYINYMSVQKWDGKLPLVVGNGATPFIDISKFMVNETK